MRVAFLGWAGAESVECVSFWSESIDRWMGSNCCYARIDCETHGMRHAVPLRSLPNQSLRWWWNTHYPVTPTFKSATSGKLTRFGTRGILTWRERKTRKKNIQQEKMQTFTILCLLSLSSWISLIFAAIIIYITVSIKTSTELKYPFHDSQPCHYPWLTLLRTFVIITYLA